ncbi:MAG: EAL domain-containing protein [Rubripirellula sp.]
MTIIHEPPTTIAWTLMEYGDGPGQRRTIKIPSRESIVGRSDDADVTIAISSISKRHARLWFEDQQLCVEDLGSTNGTHHNGQRIQQATLHEGDLVQFANAVFRVGIREESHCDGTMEEGLIPWAETLITFDRLLTDRAVIPHFQPIVTMDRLSTPGYEVLARSNLPELQNPAKMFQVAERLGQDATLSELMRDEAARILMAADRTDSHIFLNTHPVEFGTQRLTQSLEKLADDFPALKFTIEIHEGAVTELFQMRELHATIRALGMQLSYDDFGAGQGRLMELVEVPPDILKFDMQLIRDIDTASANRVELLRSLVRIAKDSGSTTLAEGVETEDEHNVCLEIGFELGQGFLYGRPAPLDDE